MSERFFLSRPITAGCMMLDGPEAHHLIHVMRASVGDEVTLFDDTGAEFKATVQTLRRTDAELRIVERREIDRELPFTLVVGVALPKGDRQKWLIEKLTELGTKVVVPLVTERSVAQPAASSLDRLRRAVIEASKQCGRNWLMKIAEPKLWTDWILAEWPDWTTDPREGAPIGKRLIAHRDGPALRDIDCANADAFQLAIGPEGGFTDAEIAAAVDAGWQKVSLGPSTLRTETAAIALVSAIAHR